MSKNVPVDFNRIFDIIDYQQRKYPQQRALNAFVDGKWCGFSTEEIKEKVDTISVWFLDNGFQKGEKIIIIPHMGRPEWIIIDFACQQVGLIVVPVNSSASVEEIEFIFTETEAKICITADSGLFFKVNPITEKFTELSIFHLEPNVPGYFQPYNQKVFRGSMDSLNAVRSEIQQDDIFTILYTSGTSGIPKGVILTHQNVVSNIKSILTILPLSESHRALSFLPFSHIFERTAVYASMAFGVSIYFSQSRESVSHDFKTVKPYFCTAVPKILEKMYDFLIEQRFGKNVLKKSLLTWAMNVGEHYHLKHQSASLYNLRLFFARLLVLNFWKRMLGGKIKLMVVGAAALRPEIGRFFSAAGIKTLVGYGMTETSPTLTINRTQPGMNRFGTVGIPIPGVKIKLEDSDENGEGEILVKGPNVMQGYFNRPELSKEVFTSDGWFKTGDVGKFVDKRFLKITDRIKDIFKTSSGKYIAPQPLEYHFMASNFIHQCLIIGFNKPFVTALFVPQFSILQAWCEQQNIHWTSPQFMVHNIKVREKIQQEIDMLNEELPNFKRIRNFILNHEEWTVENRDMTASFKLIRSKIIEDQKAEIEKLYERNQRTARQ